MMIAGITGLNPYAPIVGVQPMNYTVNNDAEVSDSYKTDATRQTAGVNAVNPVTYPNAQVVASAQAEKLVYSKEVNKAYNEIANDLNKAATGYTSKSTSTNYESLGNIIDVYA